MDGWARSALDTLSLDQVWPLASVNWWEQVVGASQESPGSESGGPPHVGDRVAERIPALSLPVSAAFWWSQSPPGSAPERRRWLWRSPLLLPHHSFAGQSLPTH